MNWLKHSGDERACQRALRAKRLLTTSVFQFRIQIVDKILFGVHAQVSYLLYFTYFTLLTLLTLLYLLTLLT